ncbi:hypothetical protein HQ945_22660, partial [Phyllobacterium sp. BT25]|nr:hypothetical protein [Phyllobacterium pellucidum]
TGSPFKAVGDKVSYAYKVTNSGNVTITKPVSVSDDRIKTVTCTWCRQTANLRPAGA